MENNNLTTRELMEQNFRDLYPEEAAAEALEAENAKLSYEPASSVSFFPEPEEDETASESVSTSVESTKTGAKKALSAEKTPELASATPAATDSLSLPDGWADKVYNRHKERLQAQGIQSAEDWVSTLMYLDDQMNTQPVETLQRIAAAYGVQWVPAGAVQQNTQAGVRNTENRRANSSDFTGLVASALVDAAFGNKQRGQGNGGNGIRQAWAQMQQAAENQRALQEMNAGLSQMKRFLDEERHYQAHRELSRQLQATDMDGTSKYPLQNKVREQVAKLLKSGQADTVDAAYNQAVWLNADIRDRLIKERVEQELAARTVAAQAAREAAFFPSGKGSVTAGKTLNRPKTTRELLEEAAAIFNV